MRRTKLRFQGLTLKILQVKNDRMFRRTKNENILRGGENCFTTYSLKENFILKIFFFISP